MEAFKNIRIGKSHIFKKPITVKLGVTTPDGTQSEIPLTYDCQHNQNKYILSDKNKDISPDKNKYWLIPVKPGTSEVYGTITQKGVVTVDFFLNKSFNFPLKSLAKITLKRNH